MKWKPDPWTIALVAIVVALALAVSLIVIDLDDLPSTSPQAQVNVPAEIWGFDDQGSGSACFANQTEPGGFVAAGEVVPIAHTLNEWASVWRVGCQITAVQVGGGIFLNGTETSFVLLNWTSTPTNFEPGTNGTLSLNVSFPAVAGTSDLWVNASISFDGF